MANTYEDPRLEGLGKGTGQGIPDPNGMPIGADTDPRLAAVEANRKADMEEIQGVYSGMAAGVKENLKQQQAMTQEWTNKQTQLQQEQTDFTIEQIEQQKEQARKDLTKEQGAAYTDYQKQTARHGVNAEQMAEQGMAGTGYNESSRVAMFTAYQNRVAVAKASYDQAVLTYNNAMKEARLQNSSVMAQIAFDGLKTQLELGLQGMQYENQLLAEMLGLKLDTKNMYHGQYMDILNQINQEKAFDESVRQHDQSFKYQQERDQTADQQWREQFEYGKSQDEIARQQWEKQFQYGQERDKTADKQWREQFEYGKSQDAKAEQQWREQFEYGKSQDEIARQQWEKQFQYGQERDQTADQQWREQFEYGKSQDKQAQANWEKQFQYGKSQDEIARQQWREQFEYGKTQDAQSQANWEKQFQYGKQQDARAEKLDAASIMASAGDFSGYKDLLGLTPAQVKKLESNYQKEVTSEADEAAYNKKLQKASLLASGGDFSGYKELFGLTAAQVKKLETAYAEENKTGLFVDPGDGAEVVPSQAIPAAGNANTKAAETAILSEKDFARYKGSGRVKVNGKTYTDYQSYVRAAIEDLANNGLNGKTFTDAEIEWLIANYELL